MRFLKKIGFTTSKALKTLIIGEGISIAVMKVIKVLTQLLIPGVMNSHLTDLIFRTGMILSLCGGFIAALPVICFMVRKEIRHIH